MSGSDWLDAIKMLGGALGIVLLGIGGFITGKRTKSEARGEGEIVAATFMERGVSERLISALNAMDATLRTTNRLMEADEQRRHDEAVIRQALKDRGITS